MYAHCCDCRGSVRDFGPARIVGCAHDHPLGWSRRLAFSLLELLVVIAIVNTILIIALPAVSAARQEARRVRCAANLAQLGGLLHAHAGLGDGVFPPAQGFPGRWDVVGGPDAISLYETIDAPSQIAVCPSDRWNAPVHGISYMYAFGDRAISGSGRNDSVGARWMMSRYEVGAGVPGGPPDLTVIQDFSGLADDPRMVPRSIPYHPQTSLPFSDNALQLDGSVIYEQRRSLSSAF